ncbi:hypothetical protein GCM10019059_36850 [Camelimonas fluminis]|uniref:Uncharacterized protein n=1 Tax=Camelimonas fluminis TaxID=1576911 RepID=A0ABV7UHW2_9HYPH|nr:hypothetical protein [Camelimonas fluminis]GHE73919.1 hypothetical protein GCM10019059_36850 [Camelimonas fluminis]
MASAPTGPVFYAFSLLSFIRLWNEGEHGISLSAAGNEIHLGHDLVQPLLYRHPAIIPMEISYNHQRDKFERAMIYSITDFNELQENSKPVP